MTMVPEMLKLVVGWLPVGGDALSLISPVRTIVFGLLIVGFLIFEPLGLAEIWRRAPLFSPLAVPHLARTPQTSRPQGDIP